MARRYAQIFCSIWDESDFCALSSNAQRTYFMLITQDDISPAGTLALRVRRWSRTLPERDREGLTLGLAELVEARMIVIDQDTEELLVRSFVRHDGGYRHSKRVVAVVAYAEATKSQSLLAILAAELDRLDVSHSIPVPPDTQSDANREPLESLRVVVTERSEDTTTLKPETRMPSDKPTPRKRGQRIPEDWKPTETDIAWARSEGYDDFLQRRETDKFVDHFVAASGQSAAKLDWSRAWKNWLRNSKPSGATPPGRAAGYEFGM